jgi:protein-L-isoaspartate(D-aspartate) O-methyltransferase
VAGSVGPEFRGARRRLVETLQTSGIRDLAVLRAVDLTPRHMFVPTGVRHRAYEDSALPIGSGQTISQPSVHARYLELLHLTGNERVLEVGTGHRLPDHAAVASAAQVFSIERVAAPLSAHVRFYVNSMRNVSTLLGDGSIGWREYAPYDAILVSAGPRRSHSADRSIG